LGVRRFLQKQDRWCGGRDWVRKSYCFGIEARIDQPTLVSIARIVDTVALVFVGAACCK